MCGGTCDHRWLGCLPAIDRLLETVHITIREETTSHGTVYALVANAVCQVGDTGQGANAHQIREKVQRSGICDRLQLLIQVQLGVQASFWLCAISEFGSRLRIDEVAMKGENGSRMICFCPYLLLD